MDPVDTYLNFSDLPSSASEGDQAFVTTTDQLYVFVEDRDGDKIKMWLPADIAGKVQGYVKTTSGQPVKIQSTPRSSSEPSPFEWPEEEEGPDPALEGWDDDPLDS